MRTYIINADKLDSILSEMEKSTASPAPGKPDGGYEKRLKQVTESFKKLKNLMSESSPCQIVGLNA